MEQDLAAKVNRFFEILDTREESYLSVREFAPTRVELTRDTNRFIISSVRVMRIAELNKLFREMKLLSRYEEYKQINRRRIQSSGD